MLGELADKFDRLAAEIEQDEQNSQNSKGNAKGQVKQAHDTSGANFGLGRVGDVPDSAGNPLMDFIFS